MANRDLPRRQGLYDPAFEHDACGVAFVVDLHGRKSHEHGPQGHHRAVQPAAPRRVGQRGQHRRRRRASPSRSRTASCGRSSTSSSPRPARTRPASRSCPRTATTRDKAVAATRRDRRATRASRVLGWRDVPTDHSMLGATAASAMPTFRQCSSPRTASPGIELDRLRVHRAQARSSTRSTCPTTTSRHVYFPSLSCRTLVYKGMLTTPQLEEFYPDLQRRAGRERARARALAVLDQHVPVLAARAPVPLHRAQRRDQHAQGQPQLDARPRGAARVRPVPRRPRPHLPDLHARTRRTPSSFDEVLELLALGGRSLPHAVLMMIPEAWENHESMSRGEAGVLPVPRVADGAVGRPRVDRVHRRHRHRRGARPQRAAAVAGTG